MSRVACRVLAPPEAPGKRPRSASVDVSPTPPPGSPSGDFWANTTTFASQLLSHFRVPAFAAASPEAVLREASTKERELQSSKAQLDVTDFLEPVGVWELKHIRKLSSLTGLTYFMHLVTPRRLQRAHNVELVVTSRACDIRPYEHNRTAEEVGADGDGMAVSVLEVRQVYQSLKWDASSLRLGLGSGSSNIVTVPRELSYQLVSPGLEQQQQTGGGTAWPVPPSLAPTTTGQQQPPSGAGVPAAASPPAAPGALVTGAGLPRMLRSPAEVVAAKLAEAAGAASAAAAGTPLASAAESLYAGLASLPIGGALVGANNRASNAIPPPPPPPAASSVDGGAAAPPAPPVGGVDVGMGWLASRKATAATIAALASDQIRQQSILNRSGSGSGSTGSSGSSRGSGMAAVNASGMLSSPAAVAATAVIGGAAASGGATGTALAVAGGSSSPACPSEWFVVDDPATYTRLFVIQGSDTLDHWKLNLTFDPVTFEEPSLGVKVHRGVYEAALVLYDRFLPLVYEHLESSPFSKIAFTGHSIGGSLATLLMLMYRHRGVLPPHSISTVYTFGAPAVFCQTANTTHTHGLAVASTSISGSSSMWSLGSDRSTSSVVSVEDAPAADMVGHGGCGCGADTLLARMQLPPHIVRNIIMARDIVPRAFACDYSPVADILKGWGSSFKDHCCLNRHGRKHLYYFVGRMCILQPDSWHSFVANDPDHPMLPPGPELYCLSETAAMSQTAATAATATDAAATQLKRPAARNVTEAIWELMDCPHPLETLADPGAYLASGTISRYHNPEHYTKALGRIKHLKRVSERREPAAAAAPGGAARVRYDGRQERGEAPSDGEGGVEWDAAVAVPWDSSDGLDLDLHLVAPAQLATDAHTCR